MLANYVENKRSQWNTEAEMFVCRHGKSGGKFIIRTWANGNRMAEVPGARRNQAVSYARLQQLAKQGWKIWG